MFSFWLENKEGSNIFEINMNGLRKQCARHSCLLLGSSDNVFHETYNYSTQGLLLHRLATSEDDSLILRHVKRCCLFHAKVSLPFLFANYIMYKNINESTHTHIHPLCVCVCVCVCMYIYIYLYIYTYSFIFTMIWNRQTIWRNCSKNTEINNVISFLKTVKLYTKIFRNLQ